MNLLAIVQQFCLRTGLPSPQLVMTSQDDQYLQIAGLANEVLQDLIVDYDWQALAEEAVFTSVAGASQGFLSALAPGYQRLLSETLYDRTRMLPIWGPRSASSWQAMEALPLTGPFYQFRLRGNELLFNPPMEAGHEIAFEYISSRAVLSLDNTRQQSFESDTDTCLLPPHLILLGLRWKWKEEKGLAYAENRLSWNAAVVKARASDKMKSSLSLNSGPIAPRPGIFVPSGNWEIN